MFVKRLKKEEKIFERRGGRGGRGRREEKMWIGGREEREMGEKRRSRGALTPALSHQPPNGRGRKSCD